MECHGLNYLDVDESVKSVSKADPDSLIDFYLDNLKELDPNGDGFASRSEVEQVFDKNVREPKPRMSVEDKLRQPYHVLNYSHRMLSNSSNDEYGPENSGITLSDLESYKRSVEERRPVVEQTQLSKRVYSEPKDMLEFFKKHRQEIDKNGDHFIDREEMEKHYLAGEVDCGDISTFKALYLYADDLEELSNDEFGDENDGITLADMEAYNKLQNNGEQSDLVAGISEVQQYSSGLIPVGEPHSDYKQFAKDLPVAFGGIGAAIGAPIGFVGIGLTVTAMTEGLGAPLAIPYGTAAGAGIGWTVGYFVGKTASFGFSQHDYYKKMVKRRVSNLQTEQSQ